MYDELYQAIKLRFGDVNASQSMGAWICANTTIKKRPFSFEGYRFQEAIADDMHNNVSVIKCSQIGLALPLDTPLPTPTGWTTMGEVNVGDQIFDEKGQPTLVTFKSEIYTDHRCFDIEFDDGTVERADENHRWFVKTSRGAFNNTEVFQGRGRPLSAAGFGHEGVVNTAFLWDNFRKAKFYIPTCGSLKLPDAVLPMDPYIYGSWLGDGTRYSATLTVGDQDIVEVAELFKARGVDLVPSSQLQYRMLGQYKRLRLMGVLGEAKRIPMIFQRASVAQRLELLRGLMDTDGSITEGGRASFHNTEEGLVADVQDLLHGLGYKTRTRWRKPDGSGFGGKKQIAEVSFVPDEVPVFNLKRKACRQNARQARPRFTKNRTIIDVRPAPSVAVQCLTVEADSHLFLMGRSMIPTHNTEVQIRKFLAILTRSTALNGIFSLPNEAMFTRTYNGRIKPILDADAVFNPPSSVKPTRSRNQIQIRDSFGYISGCTEGDATNTSADFVFHDELDLSPETIIALYQSRLQGSDMRMVQQFSTPTFTGVGIHKSFQLTDQREYTMRCSACRHTQVPRFTPAFVYLNKNNRIDVENFTDLTAQQIALLDLEDCHVRCEKCSARLDLGDADRREWLATYPLRQNFRGYRVRPFSTPRIKPAYIFGQLAQYQERSFTRGFYNTVLGEEYDAADARIQEADVKACLARGQASIPDVSRDIPCFLGIDVGLTCYITISYDDDEGFPVFVLFDTVPAAYLQRRVEELMQIYNIVQGAIDRFPYTTDADALRDITHGLVVPIQYRGNQALAPVMDADTKVLNHYSANNTLILDRIKALVSHRKVTISGYQGQGTTVIKHLTSMVRDDKPNDGIEVMAEWRKTDGDDHYMHSMAFNLLARRVCEHMYATQISTVATVSSFLGAPMAGTQGMLNFNGTGKMNGLERIARLG
jgi:hypothetical protein